MPLPRSPACPLPRARLEANRPNRDRRSFRAARKVRRRVAESAAQSGLGRSARPTSVRVLMASSRSRPDGDLSFFPVVQSAAAICRLWCVSLPYAQQHTATTHQQDDSGSRHRQLRRLRSFRLRVFTHGVEILEVVETEDRVHVRPVFLLSPLIACLDPRCRFPILNRREEVAKLLKEVEIGQWRSIDPSSRTDRSHRPVWVGLELVSPPSPVRKSLHSARPKGLRIGSNSSTMTLPGETSYSQR